MGDHGTARVVAIGEEEAADLPRKIGCFLREIREEAGLSQRELKTRLRKSLNWVSLAERGQLNIKPQDMLAWAAACGRSSAIIFVAA